MAIRVIAFGETSPFDIVNFDNDTSADNFLAYKAGEGVPTRELTAQEITNMFGNYGNWAGDALTQQSGATLATVVFSRTHPMSDLEQAQKDALSDLQNNSETALQTLRESYGDLETATWNAQETEARAWKTWNDGGQSGDEPDTPFIDDMISGSGNPATLEKSSLTTRIVTNADAIMGASGDIIGQRVSKADAIRAATTVAGVEAINVAIVMPSFNPVDK